MKALNNRRRYLNQTLRKPCCCRDGAVVRALASHQYGLGSTPARCHVRVDFDGFRFTPNEFMFSTPQKTQHSKFQFDQKTRLMWL